MRPLEFRSRDVNALVRVGASVNKIHSGIVFIPMFVGLLGGGGVLIRHEESLQVRHLEFHHSGDSAICEFAIRMRFMLRLRVAILRFCCILQHSTHGFANFVLHFRFEIAAIVRSCCDL